MIFCDLLNTTPRLIGLISRGAWVSHDMNQRPMSEALNSYAYGFQKSDSASRT
jgi:hypothetical protein